MLTMVLISTMRKVVTVFIKYDLTRHIETIPVLKCQEFLVIVLLTCAIDNVYQQAKLGQFFTSF